MATTRRSLLALKISSFSEPTCRERIGPMRHHDALIAAKRLTKALSSAGER